MGVTITPVAEGRLEILLNGEMLFDRKAEGGTYPNLAKIWDLKKVVKEKLQLSVAAN